MIKLNSRNLLVNYLQVYLKDYFGITLVKSNTNLSYLTDDRYEISQSEEIKVTGRYNLQTYLSTALFMVYNYPNEKFPVRWDLRNETSTEWVETPFDSEKLYSTMNLLISEEYLSKNDNKVSQKTYDELVDSVIVKVGEYLTLSKNTKLYTSPVSSTGFLVSSYSKDSVSYGLVDGSVVNSRVVVKLTDKNKDPIVDDQGKVITGWVDEIPEKKNPGTYFDYETLLKYFNGEDGIYDTLYRRSSEELYTTEDILSSVIVFLTNNLVQVNSNPDVVSLNDRIVSYILEEVVTSISSPDEILRVQKLLYPQGVEYVRSGRYDQEMTEDIKKVQQDFINLNTVITSSGNLNTVLPEGYDGFKVTGYVDPWTELILKGGLD